MRTQAPYDILAEVWAISNRATHELREIPE